MGFKVKISGRQSLGAFIEELNAEGMKKHLDEVMPEVVQEVANRLWTKIVFNLQNGRADWPALSRVTEEIKGSAQPLRDQGDLQNAIRVAYIGQTALVGIPDGMQHRDGTDLQLIAAVMEEGAVITVTDRMRGWMAARGFPLRKDTQVIVIPARPFFEPAVREVEAELPEILAKYGKRLVG